MKKSIVCLAASFGIAGFASAAPHFHSNFDEASLAEVTGLNIDTPAPVAGNNGTDGSGTAVLNTVDQTLDVTAMDANMWTTRDGAPIAWVSAPIVAEGDTWFVETRITYTDSPDGAGTNPGWDQAGITFYSGTPGANPGSENIGTDQSLFAGINDWNAWTHTVQGFADNNPHSGDNGIPANTADDTFDYRVEVTEGGDFDTYNFFYREEPGDDWTQYGPVDLVQDFDNSAVGVYVKAHNNNMGVTAAFGYLTVDVIPGLSGDDTDGDGIDDGWERASTATELEPEGNLTDLNGAAFGPGPGAGSGDFDGDGLTDFEEFELAVDEATYPALDPTLADTDNDGRDDGDEVNGVVGPPAIPATDPTNPDSDGDGLLDGAEDNSGTFVDATETGSDPTMADSDGDGLDDQFEVVNNAAGYDPNVDDSATDFDADSSTVAQEVAAGTDVLLPDTDGDGFYDGAETNTGTFLSYDYGTNTGDTGTNPIADDSDGDGLLDGVENNSGVFADETETGSDPNLADSDADGLDDNFEVVNNAAGYDPNVDDSASDFDSDGADVSEEIGVGTDVLLPDTDGDGFYDGAETNTGTFVSYDYDTNTGDTGTDPLNSDSDGDGLLDGVESGTGTFAGATQTGSNPNLADSDGDTFNDGTEVSYGGDPNDNTIVPDITVGYMATGGDWLTAFADFDIDGDGALGTDGFIFFGELAPGASPMNNQPYRDAADGDSFTGIESDPLPSYLASHDPGADFVSIAWAFAPYGFVDDPIALDGSDVQGGIAVSNLETIGSSLELVDFEISNLGAGQVVRVGILGGVEGNSNGNWDPTSISLSGPNGYFEEAVDLEINPGGANAGWLFFDITDVGTYTVSATRRLDIAGAGVGGLTFDSTSGSLAIQSIEYNTSTEMITLTWNSTPGATYGVFHSADLADFGADVNDSIDSQGETTSFTFPNPATGQLKQFFRVLQN